MTKIPTILHMSVSMDGFIAKLDGDSDWVSPIDNDLFEKRYTEAGCIVMGRKTFEQFQGSLYPIRDITNIVLTHDISASSDAPNVFFVHSLKEATDLAIEKGHTQLLIGGGGTVNASFVEQDLIDEIFLSVHPFSLGEGIKLFQGSTKSHNFTLVGTREMGEGLVELHYKK